MPFFPFSYSTTPLRALHVHPIPACASQIAFQVRVVDQSSFRLQLEPTQRNQPQGPTRPPNPTPTTNSYHACNSYEANALARKQAARIKHALSAVVEKSVHAGFPHRSRWWSEHVGELGRLYLLQSKYTRAEESYTRAQEIYTRLGDDHGQANTFSGIGNIYQLQSKHTQAEELFTRAQEVYGRVGDDLGQARSLFGLGQAYCLQSKYTEAEEPYMRAQEIFTCIGDDQSERAVQSRSLAPESRP
ncbi:hypothetical protein FRC04_002221 [Tulasnella sp. 424]|nr:hypothetical protein FRC04_002221 [Tulasnella sp. 424]